MTITSQMTRQKFIAINFILMFSKKSIRIAVIVAAVLLICAVIASAVSNYDVTFMIVFLVIFLVYFPLIVYYSAVKNFNSSKTIREAVTYEIDNEKFSVKGESYHSSLAWNMIHKVTRHKNWIILWQNNAVGHVLPGATLNDAQVQEIKAILENHKVTNNL